MRGNKGQFFLLAAVIISAVIISFGAGTNRVTVNEEPTGFYDSSDEVRRELAAFLDYAVFSDASDEDLVDFLDELADNMKETNPDIDFAFIYKGDGNKIEIRNYGSKEIYVNDKTIEGREQIENDISMGVVGGTYFTDGSVVEDDVNIHSDDSFLVRTEEYGDGVSFPSLDDQRVILIMQKEERGDVYVSIG